MTRSGKTNWLLDYGGVETPMQTGRRAQFDDDNWLATMEHVELGDDLRMIRTEAEMRSQFVIEASSADPELWVGGNVVLRGRAEVRMPSGERAPIDPQHSVLLNFAGSRIAYGVPAPQQLHLLAYKIRHDRIRRMFGDELPDIVTLMLRPDAAQIMPMPADATLRRVARSAFSNGLTGVLLKVFLEGALAQLFTLQAAALRGSSARQLAVGKPAAIEEARRLLLADMQSPPSLSALAQAVGLSEKALNAGFRQLFGTSVFETLRNERLEHARLALIEQQLPLKLIAARVGYSHVSNFVAAFTARYGAPPRRYLARADKD